MSTELGSPTHYETLGVDAEADLAQIKTAHRRIMRANHPDIVGDAGIQACAAANVAFGVLTDAERRAEYDRSLNAPEPAAEEVPEWGQERDWEAPPAPQQAYSDRPATAPPTGAETIVLAPVPVRRPIDLMRPLLLAAAALMTIGLGLSALPGTISLLGLDTAGRAAIAGTSGVLGGLIGLTRPQAYARLHPLIPLSGCALVVVLSWVAAPYLPIIAFLLGLVMLLAARLRGALRSMQAACDISLPADALVENNVWGGETPQTSTVETWLSELLDSPGVRLIRLRERGLTHLLIYRNRAVLIGLVPVSAEPYRWTRAGLKRGERVLLDNSWTSRHRALRRGTGLASIPTIFITPNSPHPIQVNGLRPGAHIVCQPAALDFISRTLNLAETPYVDQWLMNRAADAAFS